MARINDNFLKLKAGYLFPEIARRVKSFSDANPDAPIIKLGIGDVTEPLPAAIVKAMHEAVDEMADRATFRGYGPEQGYPFLRDAICENDYAGRGINISADEIFISDGSKCDTGNILDIFGNGNRIAVLDPVYPVYVDTNVMAGNTGESDESGRYGDLLYLELNEEHQFQPQLPDQPVDLIYLCYPNNPTGMVATKEMLQEWVNYANEHNAIILYDAAYEAFVQDESVPRSIFEIEGARTCAIEFRSFSKTAGFTGTRCAFTVIPKDLKAKTESGELVDVHPIWSRRHSTKFNGVSYPVQKGAAAAYSAEGKEQIQNLINFYMTNAAILRKELTECGFTVFGGEHAPYVWLKTPAGVTSWEFFDQLLADCNIVGTPGSGFGACGEGYFRLSAFNSRENIDTAVERIKSHFTATV